MAGWFQQGGTSRVVRPAVCHRRSSRVLLRNFVACVVTDEGPEQGVWRGGKRVGHGDTSPREALLQILREQQSASGFCRSREDHGIPDAQVVIGRHLEGMSQDEADSLAVAMWGWQATTGERDAA